MTTASPRLQLGLLARRHLATRALRMYRSFTGSRVELVLVSADVAAHAHKALPALIVNRIYDAKQHSPLLPGLVNSVHTLPKFEALPGMPAAQQQDEATACFVKALYSRRGDGVLRVHRTADGRWAISQHSDHALALFERRADAVAHAKAQLADARDAAGSAVAAPIVQAGVQDALRLDGCAVDVRALVQRRPPRGDWACVSLISRIAASPAVWNTSRCAHVLPTRQWLVAAAGARRAATVLDELTAHSVATAQAVEQKLGDNAHLAELACDYLLDRQLRCWLIEVNSHPDKSLWSGLPDERSARGGLVEYGAWWTRERGGR